MLLPKWRSKLTGFIQAKKEQVLIQANLLPKPRRPEPHRAIFPARYQHKRSVHDDATTGEAMDHGELGYGHWFYMKGTPTQPQLLSGQGFTQQIIWKRKSSLLPASSGTSYYPLTATSAIVPGSADDAAPLSAGQRSQECAEPCPVRSRHEHKTWAPAEWRPQKPPATVHCPRCALSTVCTAHGVHCPRRHLPEGRLARHCKAFPHWLALPEGATIANHGSRLSQGALPSRRAGGVGHAVRGNCPDLPGWAPCGLYQHLWPGRTGHTGPSDSGKATATQRKRVRPEQSATGERASRRGGRRVAPGALRGLRGLRAERIPGSLWNPHQCWGKAFWWLATRIVQVSLLLYPFW